MYVTVLNNFSMCKKHFSHWACLPQEEHPLSDQVLSGRKSILMTQFFFCSVKIFCMKLLSNNNPIVTKTD